MAIFFFLLGLAAGSFLNSVIYRLDIGESIIKKRSHCPFCKKPLSVIELIPLVSFILQKGRCKSCKKPISPQHPLVELATGILFVLIYNFSAYGGPHPFGGQAALGWQFSISVIFWLFAVSCLIVIFVYDLKHYIIPNQVIYPAIVLAFGFRIWDLFRISNFEFRISNQFLNYLMAAIIAGLFFLVIILISKGRWMGMGDAKLAFFMGLVLGWPKILVALFLAFLIGAFVSIILIILKKKTLKSEIPFGPFLTMGTIITLFTNNTLIVWYLNLLSL